MLRVTIEAITTKSDRTLKTVHIVNDKTNTKEGYGNYKVFFYNANGDIEGERRVLDHERKRGPLSLLASAIMGQEG